MEIKQGDLDDAREITRSDDMPKKLNFVAAILEYWRPSLFDNGDFFYPVFYS